MRPTQRRPSSPLLSSTPFSSNIWEFVFDSASFRCSVLGTRSSRRFFRRRRADLVSHENNATLAAITSRTTKSIPTIIGGFCDIGGAIFALSETVETGSDKLVLDPTPETEELVPTVLAWLLSSDRRFTDVGAITSENTKGDENACRMLLD